MGIYCVFSTVPGVLVSFVGIVFFQEHGASASLAAGDNPSLLLLVPARGHGRAFFDLTQRLHVGEAGEGVAVENHLVDRALDESRIARFREAHQLEKSFVARRVRFEEGKYAPHVPRRQRRAAFPVAHLPTFFASKKKPKGGTHKRVIPKIRGLKF